MEKNLADAVETVGCLIQELKNSDQRRSQKETK